MRLSEDPDVFQPSVNAYTSVLLGEQVASKTAGRGSTPRARAFMPTPPEIALRV